MFNVTVYQQLLVKVLKSGTPGSNSGLTRGVVLSKWFTFFKDFPGVSDGKDSACNVGDLVWSLEEKITTHSSILACRIPWTEEPGSLQSVGSWRVRHDWVTNTFIFYLLSSKFPRKYNKDNRGAYFIDLLKVTVHVECKIKWHQITTLHFKHFPKFWQLLIFGI